MGILRLEGCRLEPWASYLKGLGILRILSQQRKNGMDLPLASWEDDVFCISCGLDIEGLADFIQNEYRPTPIVSPWNGSSGFGPGDNTKPIEWIMAQNGGRFSEYQAAIAEVRTWPELDPGGTTALDLLHAARKDLEDRSGKDLGPQAMLAAAGKVKSSDIVGNLKLGKADAKEAAADLDAMIAVEVVKDTSEWQTLSRMQLDEMRANIDSLSDMTIRTSFQMVAKSLAKVMTRSKKLARSESKEIVIAKCRKNLSDEAVEWVDSATLLDPDMKGQYPPIVGGGGNEGRLDYSMTFMSALGRVLEEPMDKGLLLNSLIASPSSSLVESKMGMLDPGRSGGYNQGFGIEQKDFISNPWDFILALEGLMVFASSMTRKGNESLSSTLATPFTVRSSPIGYGSSSGADAKKVAFEIWAPVWNRPMPYLEVRSMISEGKVALGNTSPRNGVEFSEAIATYGIDRGIASFTRFGILERRGDSKVVVPLGRFAVGPNRMGSIILDLVEPLRRVDKFLQSSPSTPPASLLQTRRDVDRHILLVAQNGSAEAAKRLLASIGQMEVSLSTRSRNSEPKKPAPIRALNPDWVLACNDGCLEVRVAAALASIGGPGEVGPIRANIEKVSPREPWKWSDGEQFAWEGRDFEGRLASVSARRIIAGKAADTRKPQENMRVYIHENDAFAFAQGDLDNALLESLLFGFLWVDWSGSDSTVAEINRTFSKPIRRMPPNPDWQLLRATFGGWSGQTGALVQTDQTILNLLVTGRVKAACSEARRALFRMDIRTESIDFPDHAGGRGYAASMLIPVIGEPGLTIARMQPVEGA